MSLKNFLHQIWESIQHIFQQLAPKAKTGLHVGAVIVDNMKAFVMSPGADILTAIIPGELDDAIKISLREWLPKIAIEMRLVDAATNLKDPNEIMAAAIKIIQQETYDWLGTSAKANFLDSVAVLISQIAADGALTWDDAKTVMKWYYDHQLKAA